MQTPPTEIFAFKETFPQLGGSKLNNYDLVEQMHYLYVRVVEAHLGDSLPLNDSCNPYVEVKIGNHKGIARHSENKFSHKVFAFSRDRLQASVVEITLKDYDGFGNDELIGQVLFDVDAIPSDNPVAPLCYRLEDGNGKEVKGALLLALWFGTQADEAFPSAYIAESSYAPGTDDGLLSIGSKVYTSPSLWYLRVNLIESQDLEKSDNGRLVKAVLGNQALTTKISISKSNSNPVWDEELMFVVAEPFEEALVLSVQDRVAAPKKDDEVVGTCVILLEYVEKRLDRGIVKSRWFNLNGKKNGSVEYASKIRVRICLEGGYHVADEYEHFSSDLRPTAKELWKAKVGILDLGILGARELFPMKLRDGQETTDAYCVAKYGKKWFRTRTIIDSLSPHWNEQCDWKVFDPCTVITIGVFDNSLSPIGGQKDQRIGRIRILLSALETDRIYMYSYPLLVLLPSGMKKMGELHLAVRFRCTSKLRMMSIYSQPLLPKMHYIRPLKRGQLDILTHEALQIVAERFSCDKPPLRKEAVEFMLDSSNMWSLRRSKAHYFRMMGVLDGLFALRIWFGEKCNWKNPITTILVHFLLLVLVIYPEVLLPTLFVYLFLVNVWHYRFRPRFPCSLDVRMSGIDIANPDEMEEEFDTMPSQYSGSIKLRMRYDHLRSIAGRIQRVIGDVATQGERLQSLVSWRDSRATTIFVAFTSLATIILYVVPFKLVTALMGFYVLRHPRFRDNLPSAPLNFFTRLPARNYSML